MRGGLASGLATFCALAVASSASAATFDLGQTAPPAPGAPTRVAAPLIQVATSAGAPSYTVPFRGVVTQWSYRNVDAAAAHTARLYVAELRVGAPTWRFFIRARSDETTVAPGTRQTFAARIPVENGDLLGVHSSDVDSYGSVAGDDIRQLNSTPAPGSEEESAAGQAVHLVNVAARVESDGDGDGYGDDSQDNCVGTANASQANFDGDGHGDDCDADDDNDGVDDGADAFPFDASEWRDVDLDGRGDNADEDDDNDGLSDLLEIGRGTSTLDRDTDDDGVADAAETRSNPLRADTDGDGLTDGIETNVTQPVEDPPGEVGGTNIARFRPDKDPRTRTDPLKKDTDRDGLKDGREDRNRNGRRERRETDPRKRDTDRDGIRDGRDRRPLKRGR